MANERRRKAGKRSRPAVRTERYNIRSLHEEREYGLYWYAWLWKLLRPVLIFLCSVLIVVGMVKLGYERIYNGLFGPVDSGNAEIVDFEIESGTSVTKIGTNLEDAGLIHSGTVFKYMVQLRGVGDKVSYGSYKLSPSMSTSRVIDELTSGSQTNERVITIVPGWTVEDIAAYLLREGAIGSTDEFLSLCNNVDRFVGDSYALRFAQDAGTLAGRKYALEGYLAPDTYRIFRSASPESIIATLLSQHNRVIDAVYYSNEAQYTVDENGNYHQLQRFHSGLTVDQTIILASIIEREAAKLEDYPKVSAVLHNRLSRGIKLQSDPTATYPFGLNHYILSGEEMGDDNLYNTYVVNGLPIGPICNPSTAALEAAMQPDMDYINGGYLYYCATDPASGEMVFAVTEQEHEQNVQRYMQLWADYDAQQTALRKEQ